MGDAGEFAFVGVGEVFDEAGCGNPGDFGDFGVFVVEFAVDVA